MVLIVKHYFCYIHYLLICFFLFFLIDEFYGLLM